MWVDKLFLDTSIVYIVLDDSLIRNGDTRFKCSPPIRGKCNRKILK